MNGRIATRDYNSQPIVLASKIIFSSSSLQSLFADVCSCMMQCCINAKLASILVEQHDMYLSLFAEGVQSEFFLWLLCKSFHKYILLLVHYPVICSHIMFMGNKLAHLFHLIIQLPQKSKVSGTKQTERKKSSTALTSTAHIILWLLFAFLYHYFYLTISTSATHCEVPGLQKNNNNKSRH